MNHGRTVFAQLLDFLPQYEFEKCVARCHGNFRVLAIAQLTWRESLRDIETCLVSFGARLCWSTAWNQAGFTKNTLRIPATNTAAVVDIVRTPQAYLTAHPTHQNAVVEVTVPVAAAA